MIMILIALFIPLILIDIFTPHVLRKTTVFGISIPEPFIDDQQLATFKKQYSLLIAVVQIPLAAILIFIAFSLNDMQQSLLMMGGLFLYLAVSMVIYLKLHYRVKYYKEQQGWDEQVTVVRVSSFETKFNKNERLFPHRLFIPSFLVTIGLALWLVYISPQLPDVIPTHWGIDGQPDAWSDKSFFSVFSLVFILIFTQLLMYGLSYGIFHSSVQVKAQNTERSLQREHETRKLSAEMMAFFNLISTLFLAFINIYSNWGILHADHTLSIVYSLPIFLILLFAAVYYYMKRSKAINLQFKELDSVESSPGDDQYWKWGLFYYNKDNPDLFIEKKFGVGWSVNFARPGIWIFLFIVIVIPMIPMFFL